MVARRSAPRRGTCFRTPPGAGSTSAVGALGNVEGGPGPPQQALVPVVDPRVFFRGSLYEVVRTYAGRVFELGRHLDRMERTAARIGLALPPRSRIESELFRTLDAAGNPESYARIIVTRGEGRFGLAPHLAEGLSRLIFLIRPLEPPPPELYDRGLQMAVTRMRRNPPQALDPALKTGNYLNSVLALRESHAAGADDALTLDLQGKVTEPSTSNVFFVQAGPDVPPPLPLGCLAGV